MHTFYNTVIMLQPENLTYELVKKKFMDLDLSESKHTYRTDTVISKVSNNKYLYKCIKRDSLNVKSINEKEKFICLITILTVIN